MVDAKKLSATLLGVVREWVEPAVMALAGRLNEFEQRLAAIPAGPKGESIVGPKGEDGSHGKSAYQFAVERGYPGTELQWIDSLNGAPGKDGESIVGEKGSPGESIKGDPGAQGERGEAGEMGATGVDGAQGPQGSAGERGADGVKGEPGERGADGLPGVSGKDATLEQIQDLVGRAVAALPPPKDGKDADPIHPDTIARMVLEEVQRAVAAIPRAKDGEPGRDAAQLNVLPAIDETRGYPRGTWASHRGGLIQAARATDHPITGGLAAAGWVVITEGLVAPPVVSQSEDFREITIAFDLTSGASGITKFNMPALLDRGVWREGAYKQGDNISWDGSIWIAQRDTTAKPGNSPDWRLSVKRGRDGKDAKPTETLHLPARDPVRLK